MFYVSVKPLSKLGSWQSFKYISEVNQILHPLQAYTNFTVLTENFNNCNDGIIKFAQNVSNRIISKEKNVPRKIYWQKIIEFLFLSNSSKHILQDYISSTSVEHYNEMMTLLIFTNICEIWWYDEVYWLKDKRLCTVLSNNFSVIFPSPLQLLG